MRCDRMSKTFNLDVLILYLHGADADTSAGVETRIHAHPHTHQPAFFGLACAGDGALSPEFSRCVQ